MCLNITFYVSDNNDYKPKKTNRKKLKYGKL